MKKASKRYLEASKKVDNTKLYTHDEAITLATRALALQGEVNWTEATYSTTPSTQIEVKDVN